MRGYLVYLSIGFLLLTVIFVVITCQPISVYAATTNQTNATASVTVNSAIDVTLWNTSLSFGNLDPGASITENTNNDLRIEINKNTNTKSNISQKGSSNFSDGGSNSFTIGNLSYRNDTSTGRRNFTGAYTTPCCEFDDWKNVGIPTTAAVNRSTYYFIVVPKGQAAASYTANVEIKTGQFA